MKLKTIISILTMTIALLASAGPAHRGPVFLEQPDGYVFEGRMAGDEFYKIITTVEGNAIIKESDGWWYYAKYTDQGEKISTGHKVGTQVSSEVRSLSQDIPFHKLAENAALKRSSVQKEETPLIRRIMESGPATKAGTPKTKHGLVILAQFKDVSFKFTKWEFTNMLIQKGYSYNGATGSAKE